MRSMAKTVKDLLDALNSEQIRESVANIVICASENEEIIIKSVNKNSIHTPVNIMNFETGLNKIIMKQFPSNCNAESIIDFLNQDQLNAAFKLHSLYVLDEKERKQVNEIKVFSFSGSGVKVSHYINLIVD
jgi:hypothetical protein